MNKEIDCHYVDHITCPMCGHIFKDSWEFDPGAEDGHSKCDECGMDFLWSRHISISYSTHKMIGE